MASVTFRETLAASDPQIADAIRAEEGRQEAHLELIASENHTTTDVLEAQGSVLTNKYAEGYPGRRYYGGCEHVDVCEQLARDRACSLFGAEAANVQPHSGSQANMGAYLALLEPGDTVLAMSLDHGGHLSHGHPINFSGLLYDFQHYGVDRESEVIDMDAVSEQAHRIRPTLIVAGASAYPRTLDFPAFRRIADDVGARFLVDQAHIAGLVAGGVHPSPVPHADIVTFTTHKTMRGPRGGIILSTEEHAKKINSRVFPGMQGGPLMHVIAAKAVCLKRASGTEFAEYQAQVVANAARLAAALTERGFRIVSGGTDTHLMLVDLRAAELTGAEAEARLGAVGITANKNLIPFDEEPPVKTSGLRLGTPAATTRGMGTGEMDLLAGWMGDLLLSDQEDSVTERVRVEVAEACAAFPIYAG